MALRGLSQIPTSKRRNGFGLFADPADISGTASGAPEVMPEAQLTAAEIDRLLGAFTAGRKRSDRLTEIERLDISRPNPIQKPIFETLVILHEQAAFPLADQMRVVLARDSEIKLVDVQQNAFQSVIDHIKDPCCAFEFELKPLRQSAYLLLDFEMAFAFLDRLLGGSGLTTGRPRELTSTEVSVLMSVLEPILASQIQVWSRFTELQPNLKRMVAAPRYMRGIKSKDGVIVARYRCDGFPDGTEFSFIMPLPEIEAKLQSPPKAKPRGPEINKERSALEAHIQKVNVDLSVRVGSTDLKVSDVLALEVGDVLVLGRAKHEKLDLLVHGQPKFPGRLKRRGKSVVFQIEGMAKEPTPPAKGGTPPRR